jgi:hypothetical protein
VHASCHLQSVYSTDHGNRRLDLRISVTVHCIKQAERVAMLFEKLATQPFLPVLIEATHNPYVQLLFNPPRKH